MDAQAEKSISLHPQSVLEGVRWAFTAENYTLKMAVEKAPLILPIAAIRSCKKLKFKSSECYLLDYRLKYRNLVFLSSKVDIGQVQFREKVVLTWLQLVLSVVKLEPFRKIFFLSITINYFTFLYCLMPPLIALHEWLSNQVFVQSKIARGGCSLECGKKFILINGAFWIVLIATVSPIIWSIFAYRLGKSRLRRYDHLVAFRFEAAALVICGCISTISLYRSGLPHQYFGFVSKYRRGELPLRQPASKSLVKECKPKANGTH